MLALFALGIMSVTWMAFVASLIALASLLARAGVAEAGPEGLLDERGVRLAARRCPRSPSTSR